MYWNVVKGLAAVSRGQHLISLSQMLFAIDYMNSFISVEFITSWFMLINNGSISVIYADAFMEENREKMGQHRRYDYWELWTR